MEADRYKRTKKKKLDRLKLVDLIAGCIKNISP
jgi:hypothetical protein